MKKLTRRKFLEYMGVTGAALVMSDALWDCAPINIRNGRRAHMGVDLATKPDTTAIIVGKRADFISLDDLVINEGDYDEGSGTLDDRFSPTSWADAEVVKMPGNTEISGLHCPGGYYDMQYTHVVVENGRLISKEAGTMRVRMVPQDVIDRVLWNYTGEPYVPQNQKG